MATQIIPTRVDLGAWNQQTPLEGDVYGFRFRWNDRDGTYYFDLLNSSGEVIRAGVRMVVNFELLRQLVDEGRPAGHFVALDSRAAEAPPVFGELGDIVSFAYVESDTPGL